MADMEGEIAVVDIEREAWRMLLSGAESHVEDDLNEDGDYTDEEHEEIVGRAMAIIHDLRTDKVEAGV